MKIQVINLLLVTAIILGACSTTISPASINTSVPKASFKLTSTAFPTSTVHPVQTISPTAERFEFLMLSPDGTRRIQSKDWVIFEIIDIKSSKVLWSFSYDRGKFDKNDMDGGYGVYYWSKDGRYIYVVPYQGWDGGVKYYGNVFGAREGLARFDLNTGIMTEILPERYGGGYTFGISPDENNLVYVDQRETPLVLRWQDLFTGTQKTLLTFDEKILDAGIFGWSPQMDKMTFIGLEVQNPGYTDGSQNFFYSIFVINLEKPQPYRLIQEVDRWLEFKSWNEQDQVFYADQDDTIWQLDLESNALTAKGTATPSP